jgi:hypothetical protein
MRVEIAEAATPSWNRPSKNDPRNKLCAGHGSALNPVGLRLRRHEARPMGASLVVRFIQ